MNMFIESVVLRALISAQKLICSCISYFMHQVFTDLTVKLRKKIVHFLTIVI